MRKLVLGVLAACTSAVLLAGCGSAKEEVKKSTSLAAPKAAAPSVRTPAGGLAATAAPGAATDAPALSQVPASPPARTFKVSRVADLENRVAKRVLALVEERRAQKLLTAKEYAGASMQAVRDLTDAVLVEAGLHGFSFQITGDGRIVMIEVPRKAACEMKAAEPAAIEQRIDGASQIVDKVTLRIRGSSSEPATYIQRHCRHTTTTPAPGRVVFQTKGSGIFTTRAFRVRSKDWTIEYENAGAILQVYVYKAGKLRGVPVNVTSRGTGKQIVSGAGRFTLRVASTGKWTLRVRDGS